MNSAGGRPAKNAVTGRDVVAAAAARGVDDLQRARDASMQHARQRAAALQSPLTSSLHRHTSAVQHRSHAQRAHIDALEAVRASRSAAFDHPVRKRRTEGAPRNELLELVEDLPRGPRTFRPPADDPHFDQFEPNSGTRLRKREVSHAQLQAHLDGRYPVDISTLYSLTTRAGSSVAAGVGTAAPRAPPSEVPLYGDWVLLGVVGEKSPMKYCAAPAAEDDAASKKAPADFEHLNPQTRTVRKYFVCKLLALDVRILESNRALPGHCVLTVVVFEPITPSDDSAFHAMWKMSDGTLVALLNPRILPSKRKNTSSELSVTPRSTDAVLAIGLAEHYAQCEAIKKDGARCSAFVIKGKGNGICDFHLETAIASRQRSRMEFATSTSSMVGGRVEARDARAFAQKPSRRNAMCPRMASSAMAGLEAGSTSAPYTMNASTTTKPNDPSSATFDIESRFGRGLAEKELRKRKHASSDNLNLQPLADPQRTAAPVHREPEQPAQLDASADADERFLANIDRHSLPARTLHMAQATLRGESARQIASARRGTASPGTSSAATQRLLERHTAASNNLPAAVLQGKRFRSNVLDRDGPAARQLQMRTSNADDADGLIIISPGDTNTT
ncbi:hypothetical protein MSPP1_000507 [Malassezia sp. CBS 17886]|nr:hypothetical protein MSPP1_000507 [Malassezia sp. CBS 17886]